ncbi:ribosome silencing factor [Roseomonas elaeocarpi]|uniref:Ribosomal silencing factor RsfS n=1 Tax=Roseomonas elaeocarpi TaxID=907779 RepID=A0ABV6JRQ7_9PROT
MSRAPVTASKPAAKSTRRKPADAEAAAPAKPRASRAKAPAETTEAPAKAPAASKAAAKPRAPKRVKAPAPVLDRLVSVSVASLEDDKAESVVVLDISTRSSFADRMIIATGLADRQIQAMATHVEEALEKEGIRRIRTESSPDWVLLDAGDLVIHLFKPEARLTYAIERMWGPHSPLAESAAPDVAGQAED